MKRKLFSAAATFLALLAMSNGVCAANYETKASAATVTVAATPVEDAPGKTEDSATPKVRTAAEKRLDARTSLEAAAKKAGLDVARVKKFCNQLEARQATYSVSDDQVSSVYKAIEEMIGTTASNPFCDAKKRIKLAEETLHNLACPTEIDQGSHPTCNVTTLEVYMASRHPEVYADMVRQLAIGRAYKTMNGENLDVPKDALMPGVDEKAFDIDKPNQDKRNRASQFVQMTLVNGVYQTGRFKKNGTSVNKDRRYVMGPQTTHKEWDAQYGWVIVFDTEDKMIDGAGKEVLGRDGKKLDNPDFTTEEILEASDMVLGYKMPYIDAPYQIQGQPWVYDLPDAARLQKLKTDGKLPLGVPTKGGIHVQTIHDVFVDSKGQCWVLIDNQHGAKDDGWVTLQELHSSQKNANYDMKPRKAHP